MSVADDDLWKAINAMDCVVVYMKQVGGKYCCFKCPVCGAEAHYKWTSSSGWCETCDSAFQNFDPFIFLQTESGMHHPNAMGLMEIV